mgnify:CR=1 FL=1
MYLLTIFSPIIGLFVTSFFCIILNTLISVFVVYFSIGQSLIFSSFLILEVIYLNSFCLIDVGTWVQLGELRIHWVFFFDKLSTLFLFLIIFISFLVHVFALDYLNDDPHLYRFLVLLSLFTVFMELLVTSGNLLQFFLGWEGVGLMSYLLINFWFTRYSAANSGLMAIIYNRIGDSVFY